MKGLWLGAIKMSSGDSDVLGEQDDIRTAGGSWSEESGEHGADSPYWSREESRKQREERREQEAERRKQTAENKGRRIGRGEQRAQRAKSGKHTVETQLTPSA